MKRILIVCVTTLVSFTVSCGVSQSDYDKLSTKNDALEVENTTLKTELDECNNGAEKLVAKVEQAYKQKQYVIARQNIELLSSKHPESPMNAEFKKLLVVIEKEERAEQRRQVAREKEKIRLANLNNTGMWMIKYFVDDFGEPTKKGYIINRFPIKGTFSNSATQDSDLEVRLIVTSSSSIAAMLYEYAGNNPVKGYSKTYSVLMQDKDGERYRFSAGNPADRLRFSEDGSKKVHNALMKGGTIKFAITEDGYSSSQYQFTIENTDWYDNAYKKLMGRK